MLNESVSVEKESQYYIFDHDGHKLLPKGMSLICYYYRNKHGLNNMFSARNYNETCDFIYKFKNHGGRFGVVYINTIEGRNTSTHKGAIVIDGAESFILDPLGMGTGSGAKELKEYLILKKLFTEDNIYISNVKIQRDYTSCGTCSFLFLKEALRMGDTFKKFMIANSNSAKEVDTLPPNLLKYMQSINDIISKNKDNNDYYAVYPEMPVKHPSSPNKTTETLIEYVERNSNSSPYNKNKKISVAASKRAVKHIGIIKDFLNSKDLDKVEKDIIRGNSPDYLQENLSLNIPVVFSFTPIKKEKQPSTPSTLNDDVSEFNVFDFVSSDSPIRSPSSIQVVSDNNIDKLLSPRNLFRDITNLTKS